MGFRRFASGIFLCLLFVGIAGPATAQSCLLGILCPAKLPPAPSPPPLPPSPVPALPPTDAVTQPVTDTVNSIQASKMPVAAMEGQMLNLINAERAAAGIPALQVSAWAQSFARDFSEKMMAAGTIWHNPDYFARGRSAMGANLLSENVGYDSSISANHVGFMRSPSHRANIVDARLTHVGIGVAVSPSGRIYVTEDFARIPGSASPPARTSGGAGKFQVPMNAPATVPLALANESSGAKAPEAETITLSAQRTARVIGQPRSGSADPEISPGEGSQSPAPMIPGLVTGGVVAILAPLMLLAKKLLLLLNV